MPTVYSAGVSPSPVGAETHQPAVAGMSSQEPQLPVFQDESREDQMAECRPSNLTNGQ